jgi:hypothetical protein
MATVLGFGHEIIMSGKSLPRPMNHALSKIIAPPSVATTPNKRPVMVIEPRAGDGPGIGGFKAESEIGDALTLTAGTVFDARNVTSPIIVVTSSAATSARRRPMQSAVRTNTADG